MAATAYLTLEDVRLIVPDHLQREWNLHEGDLLQVSPTGIVRPFILQELKKNPDKINWRVFEGLLASEGVDLNLGLEKERMRENESEARS